MDQIYHFIAQHSIFAPWIIFSLFLLAGMNIPISIDILIIIASLLSATIIPESTLSLYISCLLGCYFSAWISYWIGRLGGRKLLTYAWAKKILPEKRLEKLTSFYIQYGFTTLLIGRFIPFGIRNGIFMSTGISKASFSKFILRDIFPCTLWSTCAFTLFHSLGSHYEVLIKYLKIINLSLFSAFTVAVIIFICYKRRKNKNSIELTPLKSQNITADVKSTQ